jgi:hypothetical protein
VQLQLAGLVPPSVFVTRFALQFSYAAAIPANIGWLTSN